MAKNFLRHFSSILRSLLFRKPLSPIKMKLTVKDSLYQFSPMKVVSFSISREHTLVAWCQAKHHATSDIFVLLESFFLQYWVDMHWQLMLLSLRIITDPVRISAESYMRNSQLDVLLPFLEPKYSLVLLMCKHPTPPNSHR